MSWSKAHLPPPHRRCIAGACCYSCDTCTVTIARKVVGDERHEPGGRDRRRTAGSRDRRGPEASRGHVRDHRAFHPSGSPGRGSADPAAPVLQRRPTSALPVTGPASHLGRRWPGRPVPLRRIAEQGVLDDLARANHDHLDIFRCHGFSSPHRSSADAPLGAAGRHPPGGQVSSLQNGWRWPIAIPGRDWSGPGRRPGGPGVLRSGSRAHTLNMWGSTVRARPGRSRC